MNGLFCLQVLGCMNLEPYVLGVGRGDVGKRRNDQLLNYFHCSMGSWVERAG